MNNGDTHMSKKGITTKRIDLLGEAIPDDIKKVNEPTLKLAEMKEYDIARGATVYVPKDDHIIPEHVPPLVMTDQLTDLSVLIEAHMETGLPFLIEGPKGTAKTLAVAKWCEEHKTPLIQLDCSEQTKRYDFIGRFIPVNEQIVFQLGDLPRAIVLANEYKRAVICFEEINALTPNMQKVLNQLFDWRQHVYVPEIGRTFKLNSGCKLGIASTCNPSTYGGTFELNEDLKSRLTIYKITYPDKAEETHILETLFENNAEEVKDYLSQFVELAKETRRGYNQNEFGYALSTRDVVYLVQNFLAYKAVYKKMPNIEDVEESALGLVKEIFLAKYEQNEKETLEARWKSVIGSMN
jgi:midasin (ATPase involved in ribosome maturation)